MKLLKLLLRIITFTVLTVLTQVGGLVYVCALLTQKFIERKITSAFNQRMLKLFYFLALYFFTTFIIVPLVAKPLGRVQLPVTETNHLKPLSFLSCILNRNYVRPEMKEAAFDVAEKMNVQFPGTTVNYLDANFPFINKFPLFPHLSHNDGKKLDLAFCYMDNRTDLPTNDCPSAIGYGICEEPLPTEKNTADFCAENGYWQYSLMKKVIPQGNKINFSFDAFKTKELVNLFAAQPAIGKIFIEPHLKTRLGLTSDKIRFHGCQAVRHDDHIHVQLK